MESYAGIIFLGTPNNLLIVNNTTLRPRCCIVITLTQSLAWSESLRSEGCHGRGEWSWSAGEGSRRIDNVGARYAQQKIFRML